MSAFVSEELLQLREDCVALGPDFRRFAHTVRDLPMRTWSYLDDAIGMWSDNGVTVCGWPTHWVSRGARTHLEVVEMLERAALAAMKSEGERC